MQGLPRRYWIACIGVFCLGVGLRLVTDEVDTGDDAAPDAEGSP